MNHACEFVIPILEILEIEVSNILYDPGNLGNLSFLIYRSQQAGRPSSARSIRPPLARPHREI